MPEQTDGSQHQRVDAALDVLVDEVRAHSRAPGAERAVRTVARRRAALTASAVAVVLVALAGFGALRQTTAGVPVLARPTASASSPTGSVPPDRAVPAAASLGLDRLNRASAGWVVWEEEGADGSGVSPCSTTGAPLPEALESSRRHYRGPDRVEASLERLTLGSRADSNQALRTLVEGFEACPDQTLVHSVDFSADLEVVGFAWGSGPRSSGVWLVNFADRVDVLQVTGAPAPSDDVTRQLSALLAADVQVP